MTTDAGPSANKVWRVRAAEVDDIKAIVELARDLAATQGDPTDQLDPETLFREVAGPAPRLRLWVAELAGELIGYASALPAYESSYAARGLYVADLYVAAQHRRQGVTRALIATIAAFARREGASFLWWASKPHNSEAHAFYRTLGATHEPVIAHALTFDAFAALADQSVD